MEAMITLDCSHHTGNLLDVIYILRKTGWDIYNAQGNVEYLNANSDEDFVWHTSNLREVEFKEMFLQKIKNRELICIELFFKFGQEGISFIASDMGNITLGLSIYRRTIHGNRTDIGWYFENIICRLLETELRLTRYTIEEIED